MGCMAASEVCGRPAAGGPGSPPWPGVGRLVCGKERGKGGGARLTLPSG